MRFRPGAGSAILGLPASELAGRAVEAEALWGDVAAALGERVAAARSPAAAAAELERHVIQRLADAPGPDPVVEEAVGRLMPWRDPAVGMLASSLSISERQLRRRSLQTIGFAPKLLQRVLRFQGFLALTQLEMARGEGPADRGLARLAADAGYADQSHLTRESRRLSRLSPHQLLLESARQCGPSHDHRASFGPLLGLRARPTPA